jgi:alpha-ketoglutaric semialdehyde dehydrogenase
MSVSGEFLIGATAKTGDAPPFQAFDPGTGAHIGPDFRGASLEDLETACALADAAFESYRSTSLEDRAQFLEAIAQNLLDGGDALVARAMSETGLPQGRLQGELGRTVGQLRMFAGVLRDGGYLDVRIDPALPDRAPPRADLRLTHVPLGPVAVFGASNFPLAFSVAGGDTASALAAGCPVIVKAHSAHPGTSELAGRAVQKAVADRGLHEGVFSMLFDSSRKIGSGLVADRRIQAVGFTGSRAGGLALVKIAQERKQPIPVYAEMSSINPVILLPGALAERGAAIGTGFAAALTLGSGQFCTNPGLLLAIDGPELDAFVQDASGAVGKTTPAPMLTRGIHKAYVDAVTEIASRPGVATVARGGEAQGFSGQAGLFATTADRFLDDHSLREEMFGASSLLVRCPDIETLIATIDDLEGQLTIAVHAADADLPIARRLLPHIEKKAGRILFNGFGTGVEVSHAMVHGGPFPSTSDVRSTSVGSLAIARFLRPVCYQDVPAALLPEAVADGNPLGIPRRVDGVLELGK